MNKALAIASLALVLMIGASTISAVQTLAAIATLQ